MVANLDGSPSGKAVGAEIVARHHRAGGATEASSNTGKRWHKFQSDQIRSIHY